MKYYTKIDNDILQDSTLSFGAKGLYCLMKSMNPKWKFNRTWLLSQCPKTGNKNLTGYLKELKDAGILTIHQVREGGRIVDTVWTLN